MRTAVIGYPRIGAQRDLKYASEKYFKNAISADDLEQIAKNLRRLHWRVQQASGIDLIASNDFSFYDNMLDTAFLLNLVPERYRALQLSALDTYFAAAKGYQGPKGDVKALALQKWFNTNYHYLVPEIDDTSEVKLVGTKPFDEFSEARQQGFATKPVIIGPFTFMKMARFTGRAPGFVEAMGEAYAEMLARFEQLGPEWVQVAEPALVCDVTQEDRALFAALYPKILAAKKTIRVLLQTYFGDVRDCYDIISKLDFDGIGLDFVEGAQSLALVKKHGVPAGKTLFAGVINGKNIWRNNYAHTLGILKELQRYCGEIVLNTSCSLLHVPYTIDNETKLDSRYKRYFSFAEEKLIELSEIRSLLQADDVTSTASYVSNASLFAGRRAGLNAAVQKKVAQLSDADFTRHPSFLERAIVQKKALKLPLMPTTTIGSFPQTAAVKANRSSFRRGKISEAQYKEFIKRKIAECVRLQERLGLDVLVHGEFERNDMVEYFGELLDGFLFTEKAWVQSYGTRCVKPPIVWGDISRRKPLTVEWSVYAQSLTKKPMKGMLTGPVTILNWSFSREDISLQECAFQIALAIREEVLSLEQHGIGIIQIDEAALREKLPLRKADWQTQYLAWAIPAFRLVHSGVKAATQIHTHMCYSEFRDIIRAIDSMDADVITFEASRSELKILTALREPNFKTEVGPGIYDIHSPRIPSVAEIKTALRRILAEIPIAKLWVNPDCGLKTRELAETVPSLENMVQAAQEIRDEKAG
ncbi:MAG: 5-methyltetrahydropteroyltriglutamate--homocysteine S-methyltransferase [Lentisphaerae bacterium]|nr:5-methyltetrahydropteroyltriglutamate--homocysteine S-methyltransferase [Lentisphaerota bacterium]